MNGKCGCNEGNDIFHVVRGNDFPIRICLWSKGLTFGQDRAYELEDCSEIMAKVVGSDRKVAVKARFVTTNEIRGLVETGSLPIGDYGVEVVFVNGSGIKKRILQHGVIRVPHATMLPGFRKTVVLSISMWIKRHRAVEMSLIPHQVNPASLTPNFLRPVRIACRTES